MLVFKCFVFYGSKWIWGLFIYNCSSLCTSIFVGRKIKQFKKFSNTSNDLWNKQGYENRDFFSNRKGIKKSKFVNS